MKKLILTLFIFLISLSASAILEQKKISLSEAIDIALKTNPQIEIAKLDYETSKNNIKAANSLQNPSIGTFQNIGTTAKGNPQQIGADYTIELLKRGKRKQSAISKSDMALNNQKFQEYSLVADVKISYINFLLKKTNLELIKEQSNLSKEILEYTKNTLSKTDNIQAKIAYNRSLMYENIAKSELISAQNIFNTIMNTQSFDYDTKENKLDNNYKNLFALPCENNSLSFEQVKNFALNNRYDLKKAQKEVETAQNELKVVKSKLIPDIDLQSGYHYSTKGLSETNNFASGAYVGINITNIPLIYQYQPEIKNAQLEIQKAQLRYDDLKIDITRNITDAWEKYTIRKNNLAFYNKELLENSKELLDEAIKSYNNNEINITDFLFSKKLYLEFMLEYNQALSEYYISFAELLKEMNVIEISEFL